MPQNSHTELAAMPLLAGVLALLAKISSEHERAALSKEPRGMVRALTADEVMEAKRLHDALSLANNQTVPTPAEHSTPD